MQRTSLVSSVVAFGALLAACSSSPPPSAAATAQAATCATYGQTVCSRLQECFPIGLAARYTDVAQCMDRTKQSCMNALAANGTGATTATIDACGTGVKNAACDVLFGATPIDACKPPAGTLADGAPCGDDAQCTNQNCAKSSDACGHCTALSPAGGGCVQSSQCSDGLVCNATGKCVAAGKQGAACGLATSTLCAADLVCHSGKCDKPLAVGAACNPAEQACNTAKGDQCGANQTCEALVFAKAGEACGVVNGQITSCGADGRCKLTSGAQSGTCVAAAADGQACDAQKGPGCLFPADCVNGVCTFPDPNTCK